MVKKKEESFIKINIFRNKSFLSIISMGFVINSCHLATLFILPLLLSHQYDMDANAVGGVFFIACAFSIITSIVTSRYIDYKNSFLIIYLAITSVVLGFIGIFIFWDSSYAAVFISFIIVSMGYSPIQTMLNMLIPTSVDSEEIGSGLGLYNVFNFIGMAFGPALASRIITYSENYDLVFLGCLLLTAINFCLISVFKRRTRIETY